MKPFIYQIGLNWKLNFRSKELLVHYYLVPLVFYLFIGGVFTTIIPDADKSLIQVMTVFAITMGGVLGSPYPLVEFYHSDIKKAYQVGKIPLWTIAASNFISGVMHLFLMSLLILISAPIIFKAQLPASIIVYLAALFLFIIVSLSVGMIFGLCFKSAAKMGMATQLVFLPSIMLSGIMFPAKMLPPLLQTIGRILPATWGYELMCANSLIGKNVAVQLIFFVVLLFFTGVKIKQIKIES